MEVRSSGSTLTYWRTMYRLARHVPGCADSNASHAGSTWNTDVCASRSSIVTETAAPADPPPPVRAAAPSCSAGGVTATAPRAASCASRNADMAERREPLDWCTAGERQQAHKGSKGALLHPMETRDVCHNISNPPPHAESAHWHTTRTSWSPQASPQVRKCVTDSSGGVQTNVGSGGCGDFRGWEGEGSAMGVGKHLWRISIEDKPSFRYPHPTPPHPVPPTPVQTTRDNTSMRSSLSAKELKEEEGGA